MRAHLLVAALLAGALATTVLGGGSAYAYFSARGTGTRSATTATLQTVTIAAFAGGDAPSSSLVPGGSAEVILRANNPNSYTVTAYSFTANGPVTADSGHAACTSPGVTFAAPAPTTSYTLPPGQTLLHLSGSAVMSTASQSACQGATFHIPVTLTVRR